LGALPGLLKLVEELEIDRALAVPHHVRERIEALDRLDTFQLDLLSSDGNSGGAETCRRAEALRTRLEKANAQFYESIRDAVRSGDGGDALLRFVTGEREVARSIGAYSPSDSYDYLDEVVSGVLRFTARETTVPLAPEMVPYQPTPARHIFDLIRRTQLTAQDGFVDLGSGFGHVPLLVAICTKARAIGIELEPAYVESARRSAEGLRLTNATFLALDARAADLSSGTVFYLYTPFRGAILRTVLDRLQFEASTRDIRVCAFGPCTPIVSAEPWLMQDPLEASHISFFRSGNSAN
jgi:SAM-dependent methyltransferase